MSKVPPLRSPKRMLFVHEGEVYTVPTALWEELRDQTMRTRGRWCATQYEAEAEAARQRVASSRIVRRGDP